MSTATRWATILVPALVLVACGTGEDPGGALADDDDAPGVLVAREAADGSPRWAADLDGAPAGLGAAHGLVWVVTYDPDDFYECQFADAAVAVHGASDGARRWSAPLGSW